MKRVIDNFNSIAGKLYISYGLIIVIMIISVLIGIRVIAVTENRGNELYDHYGVVQSDAAMALSYFNEVKVDIRNLLYVYYDDKDKIEELTVQINGWETEMISYLNRVGAVSLSDECEAYLKQANDNLEDYLKDVDISLSYIAEGKTETARTYFLEYAVKSASKVKEPIVSVVSTLQKDAAAEKDTMHRGNIWNFFVMGIILALAVVVAFTIATIMTKGIRGPVLVLTDAAKRIAAGDINVDIARTTKDEMGTMMENFAEMVENIKSQEKIVNSITDGNLCVQVHVRSEKDSMNQALKRMAEDNNRILTDIQQSTGEITHGSSQLSAASQTLAQGATQQASAIEEISASVKDIAGRASRNADQTREAKELVEKTRNSAITGNEEMQEMMEAMKNINESSENISKIIKVIDDIAFQTNILALNAAVEAQRAGTHGKGFAVVAEEVRNLAGKSAAASKETAELIEDSIKKVSHGSKLAGNTADALKEIVQNIDHVVDLIGGIAQASDIQASESDQIDQAVAQVSMVVQTNSATSEECAAACEVLSGQAENLRRLLEHYKL